MTAKVSHHELIIQRGEARVDTRTGAGLDVDRQTDQKLDSILPHAEAGTTIIKYNNGASSR